MDGNDDGITDDETDGTEAVPPMTPDALTGIATRFHAQADDLRRRARRILLGVLVTVVSMTVVVVVLPPIINVAEDWVLARFGYQTSQYDAQRETARQAADVRARSQTLLGLLDQRDQIISAMQEAIAQPLGAFEPEYLESFDWIGSPMVFGLAEGGGVQVAVGALSPQMTDGPPLIAIRKRGDDIWRLDPAISERQQGTYLEAASLGTSVLIGGILEGRPDLSRVTPERRVPFALDAPLDFREMAVSDDGAFIAIAGPDLLTPPVDDAVPIVVRVLRLNGDEVWSRNLTGNVADLAWAGDDLLVLSASTSFRGPLDIRTFRNAKTPNRDNDLAQRIERELIPFGFGHVQGGPRPRQFFARDDRAGELVSFLQGDSSRWLDAGDLNGADLESGTTFGDNAFALFGTTAVYGGMGDGAVARITPAADEPEVTEILLRSNRMSPQFYWVHGLPDGRVRLSPEGQAATFSPDNRQVLFYVEAEAPALPEPPEADLALVRLLEGDVAASDMIGDDTAPPIGGDATAEAVGLADRRDGFAATFAPILDIVAATDMLLAAEVFEGAEDLRSMVTVWQTEWDERERSATILSRLRTADEAGSLWRNISSLAARLAVIALLVYLVNILVNLYRYNMRLAAFYQARGDAIETALAVGTDMSGMAGSSLAELAAAHTPEDVTFGARPAPPTDAILNAIKDIAKIAQK